MKGGLGIMKSLKIWCAIVTIICLATIITGCVFAAKMETEKKMTATKATETEAETEPILVLNEEERQLMARVLYNEAGGNSRQLMQYCASVMLNQLFSPYYGETITEVLSRRNAYVGYAVLGTEADNSIKVGADLSIVLEVVDEICSGGSILPEDIWFFRAGQPFDWEGLETFEVLEDVYFQGFDAAHIAAGWH